MKQGFLTTLYLILFLKISAQTYTLKDTLKADSLIKPLTSHQSLCECPDVWIPRYEEAYAIYKATLTEKHLKTTKALYNLSRSYFTDGALQKALALSEQNMKDLRSFVPPKDSTLFPYLLNYTNIKLNNGISTAEITPLIEELQAIVSKYNDWNGKMIKIKWLKQVQEWSRWGVPVKNLPNDIEKTLYDLHIEVYGKNDPKTVEALMAWGIALKYAGNEEGQNKIETAMNMAERFKNTEPNEYLKVYSLFTDLTIDEKDREAKIRVAQNNIAYINQQCGEKGGCLDRSIQQTTLLSYAHLTILNRKNRAKEEINTLVTMYKEFLKTSNSNLFKMGVYEDLASLLQSKADELKTAGDTVAFKEYYQNALHYALIADSLISQNKGIADRHRVWFYMADFYTASNEPIKALPYLKKIEYSLAQSGILLPNKAIYLFQLNLKYEDIYNHLDKMDSVIYYTERNKDLTHNDPLIYSIFKDNITSLYLNDFKAFALYLKTNQMEKAEKLWQKWTNTEGVLTKNPCLYGILVMQMSEIYGEPQCFEFFKTHGINLEEERFFTPCNATREASTIPIIVGNLLQKSGNKQAAVKAYERTPQLYNVNYDKLDNVHAEILSTLAMNHFLLSETCGELSHNKQFNYKTRQIYTQKALHNAELAYKTVDVFRRNLRNAPWEGSKENPKYPSHHIIWNAVTYALKMLEFNEAPIFQNSMMEKAFHYSEIARAKSLLHAMLYREAIDAKPPSYDSLSTLIYQDTLLQNKLISKELDRINLSSLSNDNSERLKVLQNEIATLKLDIDLIQSELKKKVDIKLDHNIVSIPQVQEALKSDEALIEYLWDRTALHTFIIKKDSFWSVTVDSAQDLDGLITRYLTLIQDRSNLGLTARLHKKADSLFQFLFQPINTSLLPLKLIIIPHRTIGLLPFETLREGQQYLIEKYDIRYAYSATALLKMQNLTITNTGFVGFAPFATPSVSMASTTQSEGFLPLPETKKELENINKLIPGTAFYYEKATKDKFLQEAIKYKYIHLPTHAESPNNEVARIAFFNQGKKIWDKTSALYGREIYNLKFNADLITLSACETYGTKQNNDESEGIMGLARGFSQSGVKSVISTLWVVNSEKTSQLMIDFYQNLKKGLSKSGALRQVKRQMLQHKETAHPYFWAAPILIGDGG